MLKRLLFGLVLAGLGFLALLWWVGPEFDGTKATPSDRQSRTASSITIEGEQPAPIVSPMPSPEQEKAKTSEEGDSGLSLALKSIELMQGEKGLELWRLKATWGSMEKEDGKILVSKPRLTYFMPPDNEQLYVQSDHGDIDQKQQILRFIDSVFVQQKNSTIRGDLLIYNGTAKNMTFPHGGDFTGDGVRGDAPFVRWRMGDRIIEASGGVSVEFDGTKSPAHTAPPAAEKEQATPAGQGAGQTTP